MYINTAKLHKTDQIKTYYKIALKILFYDTSYDFINKNLIKLLSNYLGIIVKKKSDSRIRQTDRQTDRQKLFSLC